MFGVSKKEFREFAQLMRRRDVYLKALMEENKRLRADNKALLDRVMATNYQDFKLYQTPSEEPMPEMPEHPSQDDWNAVGEIIDDESR